MYAFRGWIGFVAFMDIGTAIRCFNEKRSFFGPHSYAKALDSQYNKMGKLKKSTFEVEELAFNVSFTFRRSNSTQDFGILLYIKSISFNSLHFVYSL